MATDAMYRVPASKEASIYAARNLTDSGNQLYVMSYVDDPTSDVQNQATTKPLGIYGT